MRINLIVNPSDTVKPLAKTVAPKLVAFFPEWIRKYCRIAEPATAL